MKSDIQLISVNMGIFLIRLDYTIDWYYTDMKEYEFIGLKRLKI